MCKSIQIYDASFGFIREFYRIYLTYLEICVHNTNDYFLDTINLIRNHIRFTYNNQVNIIIIRIRFLKLYLECINI